MISNIYTLLSADSFYLKFIVIYSYSKRKDLRDLKGMDEDKYCI
jgi:hypothetical protein